MCRREATGRGGTVDTSLFETTLAFMTLPIAQREAGGPPPQRMGLRGPLVAPNRAYETADGLLMIAITTDSLFRRLCDALGLPEVAADPRFAGAAARMENEVEMSALLSQALARRRRAEWAAALDAAGVPNAPVHSLDEVLRHPQTAATGMLQPVPGGDARLVALPLAFDGVRPQPDTLGPALGADNQLLFDFMA